MERKLAALVVLVLGLFVYACDADGGSPENQDDAIVAGDGGTKAPGAANGGGTPSSPANGLPCDVDAMLQKNCALCHGKELAGSAPMPLVTYADLTADRGGKKVYDLVLARIKDDARPMPPAPNPHVADADVKAFETWVSGGAKASAASCGNGAGDAGSLTKPLSCTADQKVLPKNPYAVKSDIVDEYVCFGVDIPTTQDRHLIAFAPVIDNRAVVHHLLLLQADESVSPVPAPCPGTGSSQWRLMAAWAPGVGNLELPEAAGVRETGTTHLVVQVHYNNPKNTPNLTDASGFEMCSTDKLRPNDAEIMAFGSMDFEIPARGTLSKTCDYHWPLLGQETHVFTGMSHMHGMGKSMRTTVLKNFGTNEIMMNEEPHFNYADQITKPVDVVIQPGDTVRTTCTWNNTGDNPIHFGEKTQDEMCWDFVFYYPKVTSPAWSWMTPSILVSCN